MHTHPTYTLAMTHILEVKAVAEAFDLACRKNFLKLRWFPK